MLVRRMSVPVAAVVLGVVTLGASPARANRPPEEGYYGGHDLLGHTVTFRVAHHHVWHFEVHGRPAVAGHAEIHHGGFRHCEADWCFAGIWDGPARVGGAYWRDEPGHGVRHFDVHLAR